jgi:hypothetical protein
MTTENPIHFRSGEYGLWRYRPWNIAWLATARYLLALLWPTLPGRNVSGRALTRRERKNY